MDTYLGMRIIHSNDGTLSIPRSHFQVERYLDNRYHRFPNQLKWQAPVLTQADIERLKAVFLGRSVYIIGKGPSLDNLRAEHFLGYPDDPIIAINDSIHKVESLDLLNPTFCMQQDNFLKDTCRPKKATLIISNKAKHYYDDYADKIPFTRQDLGVMYGSCITAVAAVKLLAMCGVVRVYLIAFDGIAGNRDYAKCLGTDPKVWGSTKRFIGHGVRLLNALALAGIYHEIIETTPRGGRSLGRPSLQVSNPPEHHVEHVAQSPISRKCIPTLISEIAPGLLS